MAAARPVWGTWRGVALGAVLAAAVGGILVDPADAARRASCRQAWGSNAKQLGDHGPGFPPRLLTGVRAARQTCFDRLVFDLSGRATGYRVEYVPEVTQDGSGAPIPLRGGAFLSVVLAAPAHDDAGRPTYRPPDRSNIVDVGGFTAFRQAAFGGSFEGQTTVGLGVRGRLPFRVFVLPGPGGGSRVVLDVAHRWS